MMKAFYIFVAVVFQSFFAFAQQEKQAIHRGNQLYAQKKYAEAEASYRQSVEKSQASVEGNFNLGDALYKQKKYDGAAGKFTDIATSSDDKAVKAQAYHNLGNSLLESNKLEESIAAYKKALLNNPKDEETRYNLAYAQEKLKEQQKKQQQDKDKKQNNDDKKNRNQGNDQDQQQQGKDKQDQNQQGQQQQDQKKQQSPDQDKQDGQSRQQPQPNTLSKEDAERMLDALNQEEKNTQDKLKNKKARGVRKQITKDW